MVMLHVMEWTALPEELEDLILSKLPLVNLARISTTCRLFQAVFRKQLAQEQKARCTLAAERFGRERIIAFITLIKRWLRGDTFEADVVDSSGHSYGWIGEDGTCHNERLKWRFPAVRFCMRYKCWCAAGWSGGQLQGMFRGMCSWGRVTISEELKDAPISVHLSNDHDLEVVAFLQVLISEGLGQIFHDAGKTSEVQIIGFEALSTEGLETLIAPLLPYISGRRRISADRLVLGALM